jgi:two-component system, OmpR family, KDP operon response regulator KdpE
VQYLRIYIRSLRRTRERDPQKPKLILTEEGAGYRLEAGIPPV